MNWNIVELQKLLLLILKPKQNIFIECPTDKCAYVCAEELWNYILDIPLIGIHKVSPFAFSYGRDELTTYLSIIPRLGVREEYTRGYSNITIIQFFDLEDRYAKPESATQSAESSTATEPTTSTESPTTKSS